jgi:hypothetical protein
MTGLGILEYWNGGIMGKKDAFESITSIIEFNMQRFHQFTFASA